jgi:hypothetical protein
MCAYSDNELSDAWNKLQPVGYSDETGRNNVKYVVLGREEGRSGCLKLDWDYEYGSEQTRGEMQNRSTIGTDRWGDITI